MKWFALLGQVSLFAFSAGFSTTQADPLGPNDFYYCGPVQLQDEGGLPTVEFVTAYVSDHPQVQKVIKKFGFHKVSFSFADGAHIYRIGQEAKDSLGESSGSWVCAAGQTAETSQWGTPLAIFPLGITTYPFDSISE